MLKTKPICHKAPWQAGNNQEPSSNPASQTSSCITVSIGEVPIVINCETAEQVTTFFKTMDKALSYVKFLPDIKKTSVLSDINELQYIIGQLQIGYVTKTRSASDEVTFDCCNVNSGHTHDKLAKILPLTAAALLDKNIATETETTLY